MILSNKKTQRSARVLKQALEEANYRGRNINYGCSVLHNDYGDVINKPVNVGYAVDKLNALAMLLESEVPTPLISEPEARILVREGQKVVGRTTYHSKGRGFYMATTEAGIDSAIRKGATHFLTYIEDAIEFRVHIVNGHSIKVSQKVFPEGIESNRRNHRFGATFEYPQDFNHKKTLRKIAKQSIEALGLDFGAVDLLYKDGKFYVLEVNTAPCLTDPNSDTLARYSQAFVQEYSQSTTSLVDDRIRVE